MGTRTEITPKNLDIIFGFVKIDFEIKYWLSRADERFGFMTPQQPI